MTLNCCRLQVMEEMNVSGDNGNNNNDCFNIDF